MTFVGRPKAFSKSNPTHPPPRFTGSRVTRSPRTGAGTPIETFPYVQSSVDRTTPSTISKVVSFGPDAKRLRSLSLPESRNLTFDPPTSTASTL
jgi:hypothetical protein